MKLKILFTKIVCNILTLSSLASLDKFKTCVSTVKRACVLIAIGADDIWAENFLKV